MLTSDTHPMPRAGHSALNARVEGREVVDGVDRCLSSVRRLGRQEILFNEGDEGGHYHEILEGVVCCYRVLPDGRRRVLSFNYPGDIIGIGHETRYGFSCEAIVETRLECISGGILEQPAGAHPRIVHKLLKAAAIELASMHDHFVMVGRKTATEKMSAFLLALARRQDTTAGDVTIDLPMKRTDIADFLGITFETVSRQITELRKRGVIDLPRTNTVHVHSVLRLEKIVESCDQGL